MPPFWRNALLIVLVATAVLYTNLGGVRLWDRDEPRNARCAREMLERQDWVTPFFNGELRTHKPVLLYWLIMSAYSVFGYTEFAARFWSAALAVGTALCTYLIGRRLFNERAGIWAGVIITTSLMFDVAGRAATPDSPLIFFTTLALTVFVYGVFPVKGKENRQRGQGLAQNEHDWFPRGWRTAAWMYAAMGVAVLAKGPVGLVLPTAVIGMFLLVMRLPARPEHESRWWDPILDTLRVFEPRRFLRTCWSMRPLTALAVALAIALPWYVWVGWRSDGEFLRGFFLEHHFGRATRAMEGHGGSLFFYPVALLIGFFPWSVFAAPVLLETIAHLRHRGRWTAGYVFGACWIGVYVGVFTVARTKLPSYVTPCYPGLALMTAGFLESWVAGQSQVSRFWPRAAVGTYMLIGLVLILGLPFAAAQMLPGEEWLAVFGLIPLGAGVACWVFLLRDQRQRVAVTFAGGALAVTLFLFAVAAPAVDRHQQSHLLLGAIPKSNGAKLAAFGCLEPSWVFYNGQPIEELTANPRLDSGAWVQEGGRWHRKTQATVATFVRDNPHPYIITSNEQLDYLEQQLPGQTRVVADVPYFLKKRRLIMLECTPVPTRTASSGTPDKGVH